MKRIRIDENLYEAANERAEDFINFGLTDYAKLRNFDFGPNDRTNISCLSSFISHRLIFEQELVNHALAKAPFSKIEKFIQEIYWRTYWKGWLELRPEVWDDYARYKENPEIKKNIAEAKNGATGIDCFDAWVKELIEENYLHNHARMWFASIWIFTLKLPWQSGANFFMEHGFSFLRDCTIHFVQQKIPAGRKKPLGTAQALQVGLEAVPFWSGHAFLVSNGDNLYDSTEIATLANSPHPNAMVAYHAHDVHPDQSRISNYALLKIEQDCLKDIVEKPDETIRSNWGEPWVSMNIWKLDYDTVLPVLRNTPMNPQRQEHELPTSMRMLAQKTDIFCYYSNASVPDLTSQQDIKRVQEIVHPIDL